MKRAIALTPIVVLGSACSLRPWTPSVSVAYWSQEVPSGKSVDLPTAQWVSSQWQLPAADPWSKYVKLTLIASLGDQRAKTDLPDVEALEATYDARVAGYRVGTAGVPADVMWVVDLRGAASVSFGEALSRYSRGAVSVVPTFNHWPDENGIIPAEETLAAMISMAPTPPAGPRSRPVFLLDAWRLAYREDVVELGVVDNRYMITEGDLPDVGTLLAQGIRKIVYVVEDLDDTGSEEDDLNPIFLSYQAAGIALFMVDLGWLRSAAAAPGWDQRLVDRYWVAERRGILFDDPAFYARARGGFGGHLAGPSPFRPGGRFRSGHGGG